MVDDFFRARLKGVHVQRIISYPAMKRWQEESEEFKLHEKHLTSTYNLVEEISYACKSKEEYEVRMKSLGFDYEGDQTWKYLSVIMRNVSGMLEHFLNTSEQRNLKRKLLDLFFKMIIITDYNSHGAQ